MSSIPTNLSLSDFVKMRDDLMRNRARGVRAVSYAGGKRVEFKTDQEMNEAINFCGDQIQRLQQRARPRAGVAAFNNGHHR